MSVPGAVDALCAMGWAIDGEDLAIAQGKFMTMSEVRQASLACCRAGWCGAQHTCPRNLC